jgi:hypothetical protein
MRIFSFFPSVLNHDESTYIVISDTILAGHLYQVDFIDTKPVGIFAVYALAQLVLGKSIIAIRLLAAIVLGCTAFFLYRAKLSVGGKKEVAFAAGFIYIFLNSLFKHWGLSPNTETFFNLFTAAALWMFFIQNGRLKYFAVGLILGMGFIIKYMVLFDGFAFGVFLIWQAIVNKKNPARAIVNSLIMAVGAALPLLFLMAGYNRIGHLDEFLFYTFTVSGRYPVDAQLLDYLIFSLDFFVRFLLVTIMFLFALFHKTNRRDQKQFAVIWLVFALTAVLISGKHYGHYFIQFMLPFSFVAGEYFAIPIQKLPVFLHWTRRARPGWTLVALLVMVSGYLQYENCFGKRDYPKEIAAYLKAELEPGRIFYTTDGQIMYHLVGQLPPVSYVHPSLFWEPRHIENLEIDVEKEMASLKSLSPQFLVLGKKLKDKRFDSWLEDYDLVKTFEGHADIYKMKDEN